MPARFCEDLYSTKLFIIREVLYCTKAYKMIRVGSNSDFAVHLQLIEG